MQNRSGDMNIRKSLLQNKGNIRVNIINQKLIIILSVYELKKM